MEVRVNPKSIFVTTPSITIGNNASGAIEIVTEPGSLIDPKLYII